MLAIGELLNLFGYRVLLDAFVDIFAPYTGYAFFPGLPYNKESSQTQPAGLTRQQHKAAQHHIHGWEAGNVSF